jgi:hypothetical protein
MIRVVPVDGQGGEYLLNCVGDSIRGDFIADLQDGKSYPVRALLAEFKDGFDLALACTSRDLPFRWPDRRV